MPTTIVFRVEVAPEFGANVGEGREEEGDGECAHAGSVSRSADPLRGERDRVGFGPATQERQREEREHDHREQSGGHQRDVVLRPDEAEVDADLPGYDGNRERRRLE